jgi:hypothetical protein
MLKSKSVESLFSPDLVIPRSKATRNLLPAAEIRFLASLEMTKSRMMDLSKR